MLFPYKVVDLTHTLSADIASWNGSCGFQQDIKLDYQDCITEVKFRVQKISLHAGIGTHVDAPSHCVPGGASIADLSLEKLIAPCVMIDVSDKAHQTYSLSLDDVNAFEAMHGLIDRGSFVIVRTGWDKYWSMPEKYRNALVFPSISGEAAQLLLDRGGGGRRYRHFIA